MTKDREVDYKKHLFLLYSLYPRIHDFLNSYFCLKIIPTNPRAVNCYGNMLILLGWIDKQNHEKLGELKKMLELLPDKTELFVHHNDNQIAWESQIRDDSEVFIRSMEVLYDEAKRPTPDLGEDAKKIFILCDEWVEGMKKLSSDQDKQIEVAVKNCDNKNKYIKYKNDEGYTVLEYPEKGWALVLDMDGGHAKLYHNEEMIYSVKQSTGVYKQFLFLWKNVGKAIPYETLYKCAHDDSYGKAKEARDKRKNIKRDFDRISKELNEKNCDIEIVIGDGIALKLM